MTISDPTSPPTSCRDAAHAHAARDWPVIPIHHVIRTGPTPDAARCACGPGCPSPGKHPVTRHGVHDASTDHDQIDQWWTAWPDAGVGIATGGLLDVLDLDGPDALDVLDAAAPAGAAVIDGPIVTTGRGVHCYVRAVPGARNRARILPGIDWRGVGGLVVAPPSIHYTGQPYLWGAACGPDRPLPVVEPWLRDLVVPVEPSAPPPDRPPRDAPEGYGERAISGEVDRVLTTAPGARNVQLNASAFTLGRLAGAGHVDPDDVAAVLAEAARCVGLGDREATATIASGLAAGMARPRHPTA